MSFEKHILAHIIQGRSLDRKFIVRNKARLKEDKDACRKYFLEKANLAYVFAYEIDEGPRADTRTAACQKPQYAYEHALQIDKWPMDETREAACKSPTYSYYYAMDVDNAPREITRKGACRLVKTALKYAIGVDKEARWDTYNACQNQWVSYRRSYERKLGRPKC